MNKKKKFSKLIQLEIKNKYIIGNLYFDTSYNIAF